MGLAGAGAGRAACGATIAAHEKYRDPDLGRRLEQG
jgi:hypothetical protein